MTITAKRLWSIEEKVEAGGKRNRRETEKSAKQQRSLIWFRAQKVWRERRKRETTGRSRGKKGIRKETA